MATKRRAVVTLVTLVGAFTELVQRSKGGRAHRRRLLRRRHRRDGVTSLALSFAQTARARLPALPSARRRRRMLNKARKRFGSLAGVANSLATMASIVAAGMELASALQSQESETPSRRSGYDDTDVDGTGGVDDADDVDTADVDNLDEQGTDDDDVGDVEDVEDGRDTEEGRAGGDDRDDPGVGHSGGTTTQRDLEEGELQHVG